MAWRAWRAAMAGEEETVHPLGRLTVMGPDGYPEQDVK